MRIRWREIVIKTKREEKFEDIRQILHNWGKQEYPNRVSENGGWLREGHKGGETSVSRNTIIFYTNTHTYVQEILKSTWFNLICIDYMHDKPT